MSRKRSISPDALKVLFAASEAHPLIKTGGLADVAGSLPAALRDLGQDVRLVLPAYPQILDRLGKVETLATFEVVNAPEPVRLLGSRIGKTGVPVYLVDSPSYFQRAGNPYTSPNGADWQDNADRFALFCRAVVQIATDRLSLEWKPDLVHANDWQTGLVAPLLSFESHRPATLFTIHNIAYQGVFDHAAFNRLQLPAPLWSVNGLEYHHNFSFIKGGIAFSDLISTVSPTYAREVQTPEYGYGLEGLLHHRADRFTGVLNGIDYRVWDPETDPLIEHHFDKKHLDKRIGNKLALQTEFGLPGDEAALLFGYVGRLVDQKGVDLILQVIPGLMERPHIQVVILGTGDLWLEQHLDEIAQRYPERVGAFIGYDEGRAHRIEAGCDAFLMPSRFEPCGLNQIYSLRYGALPIVRRTGGLADTVVDTHPGTLADGTATGFVFEDPNATSLWGAVDRAALLYREKPEEWKKVMRNGMQQDFSWTRSAEHYLDLYRRAIADPQPNPLVMG
ncbi:MAG TPA: glycogen synthase GlgA [Chromatiales bacterium]|nr:glycogen synthase GlgA [Chromatiales bacterium]